MITRTPFVAAAAMALGLLLGYAVPRPEALLEVTSDVASLSTANCPIQSVDHAEEERLRRMVEALQKDLALRPTTATVQAAVAPAEKTPEKLANKAGWGVAGEDAQKAAWAVPAENFQAW